MGRKNSLESEFLLSSMSFGKPGHENEDPEKTVEIPTEDLELSTELEDVLENESEEPFEETENEDIEEKSSPKKKAGKTKQKARKSTRAAKTAGQKTPKKTKNWSRKPKKEVLPIDTAQQIEEPSDPVEEPLQLKPEKKKSEKRKSSKHGKKKKKGAPEDLEQNQEDISEPELLTLNETSEDDSLNREPLISELTHNSENIQEAEQFSSDTSFREDLSVASASLHKSMDSMVRQWSSVKDISGSICQNLERVSKLLNEPSSIQKTQQEDEFPIAPSPRALLGMKIAVGASVFAIILSILSLTLVNSVRQSTLNIPRAQVTVGADSYLASKPKDIPKPVSPPKTLPSSKPESKGMIVDFPVVEKTTAVKKETLRPVSKPKARNRAMIARSSAKRSLIRYQAKKNPVYNIKLKKRGRWPN